MIVKRGVYYHYQFQINGKRYRGSTQSANRAEALRMEAERRMACLRNPEQSIGTAEKLKFDVAFERFLAWTGAHVKPRTHQRYRVSTKRLIAHFGAVRIERMNTQMVEEFKTVRAGECSCAGVNRDLACLRTFRNWCVRMSFPIARFHVQLFPEGPAICESCPTRKNEFTWTGRTRFYETSRPSSWRRECALANVIQDITWQEIANAMPVKDEPQAPKFIDIEKMPSRTPEERRKLRDANWHNLMVESQPVVDAFVADLNSRGKYPTYDERLAMQTWVQNHNLFPNQIRSWQKALANVTPQYLNEEERLSREIDRDDAVTSDMLKKHLGTASHKVAFAVPSR